MKYDKGTKVRVLGKSAGDSIELSANMRIANFLVEKIKRWKNSL